MSVMARSETESGTATRIVDIAERLVQSRGYNGFSYADIAAELSVSKASLHYHFPSKGALGEALIVRYATRFADALADIDSSLDDPAAQLAAYTALYSNVLQGRLNCLCGMLAAEYHTLPEGMRMAVTRFFDENEIWLTTVLARGRDEGQLVFDRTTAETARMIISVLEGGMLLARAYDDATRFQVSVDYLLASLERD